MNEPAHYTDEDFQRYFDGALSDSDAFLAHVQSCPSCRKSYDAYAATWSAISIAETEALSFDLADAVAERIFRPQPAAFVERPVERFLETGLYALLACLAIVCVFACSRELSRQALPAEWMLLLIPAAVYAALLMKEIRITRAISQT